MKVVAAGEREPINKPDNSTLQAAENRRVDIQLTNSFAVSKSCRFFLQYPVVRGRRRTIRTLDKLIKAGVEKVSVELLLRGQKRGTYRIRSGCYGTAEEFKAQTERALGALKLTSKPLVFDLGR